MHRNRRERRGSRAPGLPLLLHHVIEAASAVSLAPSFYLAESVEIPDCQTLLR